MKALKLLVLPMLVTFCSTLVAQDTKKVDEKKLEKMTSQVTAVWVGDKDKTKEQIDKMDDLDIDENMLGMILDQIGAIELEFKKDGTFEVEIGGQGIAGEWEAKKVTTKKKVDSLEVHTMSDEDSGGEEKNFAIRFLGKNHMMMVDLDDGGPPIVLKRKKAEKDDK